MTYRVTAVVHASFIELEHPDVWEALWVVIGLAERMPEGSTVTLLREEGSSGDRPQGD